MAGPAAPWRIDDTRLREHMELASTVPPDSESSPKPVASAAVRIASPNLRTRRSSPRSASRYGLRAFQASPARRLTRFRPKARRVTRPSIPVVETVLDASRVELSARFGPLEAASTPMRGFTLLNRLAPTEITVTLTGETGTGKDVIARTIHAQSLVRRRHSSFSTAARSRQSRRERALRPRTRLFHRRPSTHAGAFERAQGGTLFLDEVGELPLNLQPRLLRALENRSVRRVGGKQDRPIDVRIVAATNRDLKHRVQGGLFREDLYFRLAAAVVAVPPLRARLEDLPVIVPQLLSSLGART